MLVESVGSALVVGKLRGGKFKNLLNIEIKRSEWIISAAILQSLAALIVSKELTPWWELIKNNGIWIQLVVYGLLLWGTLANTHLNGIRLILFGITLNFIVIMANGGRMPVDIRGIEQMLSAESIEMLKSSKSFTHVAANESTRLLFLGDIIHFKRPYPLPKALSIGDILMMFGIFALIYRGLFNNVEKSKVVKNKFI